jgi:hypothetical protein
MRNRERLTFGIPVANVSGAFPSILGILGGWLGVLLMVLAPFNHFLEHARGHVGQRNGVVRFSDIYESEKQEWAVSQFHGEKKYQGVSLWGMGIDG